MNNDFINRDGSSVDRRPMPVVNVLAHFFSTILHPVFIPIYVMLFLAFIHPSYFSGFSVAEKIKAVILAAYNAVFFPLFVVLLLKGLKFIDSIFLHSQKDRIIPYIASGIFFFWTFWVFYNNENYPRLIPAFFLGMLIASSTAVVFNNYFKISMHAIGMGGWLAFFIVIMKSQTMLMTWPIAAVILLTGIVLTSRLIVSNHTYRELAYGLLLGLGSQFAAALFVN